MKISEIPFRQLDRKWYAIENYKDIKKICRIFHHKKSKNIILVYAYIDHEAGISIRVCGNVLYEDKKLKLDKEFIDEKIEILRYSEIKNLSVIEVEDEMLKKIEYIKDVEEEMNAYYDGKEDILETRKDERLDKDRDSVYVDEVRALIVDDTHQAEFFYVKLKSVNKDTDIFTGKIVEFPEQDFDLDESSLVLLKYVDRPKYTGLAYLKRKIEKSE